MDSDESSVETTSMNNGMETSSFTHINKIHCEQRTNNNTKHPYVIFRKLLENFAPDDIGDLTDFTLSYQLPINDVSKLVQILFEEAIKNPQQAASFVDVIRKQQICIKNDFLGLCTNLIVILRNDNISRNNDGLRKQADGVVTLISELFNQDLLTWQNIEGHFQRLIAYNSKGSIYMIGNMFFSCGEKLIKVMPAGCFKTLYATFQNKCFQISGSNKVSIYDIKGNTYQQISTHELLAKAIEYQSHTQKDNKFTIDDFERIIAQQEPIYENIINHLNSANINKDLDKYVNLIVRQVLKKPTMTKTFTNVLIEMRLIVKKKNQMELTLYDLLQIELTKYLKISRRNLKEERPKMQLKAQNLGNFIGELHKVDLIECSKIEIFLQKLMNKHELREGSLELVYNIIQSCSSHLQITLGTNRLNNYIIQLKRSTNPLNMSSSICEKVNSIKNHHESNINSVEESTVSSLKVNKKNSNDIVVQSSNPPSTAHTSKQLSYKDKLLERLKELHEM